jgi:hypothetical protein
MTRGSLLLLAAAAVACPACALIFDSGDDAPLAGDAAAGDASPACDSGMADAAAAADAHAAPVECAGQLLSNPSFEDDSMGWVLQNAITPVNPSGGAVDGDKYLSLEYDNVSKYYGIYQNIDFATSPQVGTVYRFELSVKSVSGPNHVTFMHIEERGSVSSNTRVEFVGLSADWQRFQVDHTIGGADIASLQVLFRSHDDPPMGIVTAVDFACLEQISP